MINFKELKESLSKEKIAEILGWYGAPVVHETPTYMIFRTCCHNLDGGSHKLYYYLGSNLFYCYTECGSFDVFTLVMRLEELRGNKVGLIEAVKRTGLDVKERDYNSLAEDSLTHDISRIQSIRNAVSLHELVRPELPTIDPTFLNKRFQFNAAGVQPWLDEGINYATILEYGIRYDPIDNCIIIPHFDDKGNLIGVRARYFNDMELKGKYRPIIFNREVLRHALSMSLYGLHNNKEAIKRTGRCVIVEGEKSVLKMASLYGANNIGVAVCGKNISVFHMKLLYDLGVKEVVVAFDADYATYEEIKVKQAEYKRIAAPLGIYFNTSIVVDYGDRLAYRDSPIDQGKQVFEALLSERIYI